MNKKVFTWFADPMSRPETGVIIWRTEKPPRSHEVVDLSTPYAGEGVWDAVREVIREGGVEVTVIDRIDQKPASFETMIETRAKVEVDPAEARCTGEAQLRREHSPEANPKDAQACARRREGKVLFLRFHDGRKVRLEISSESFENAPIESVIKTDARGITHITTRFTADVTFASITTKYTAL